MITRRYREYLDLHRQVRARDEAAAYRDAVSLAVNGQAAAAATLDKAFKAEIATARHNLDSHAEDARQALRALRIAIAVLAVLAAALAVIGLQRRIREYR